MNVAIIGNGLVSLTLAKVLVTQGIYVDFFSNFKEKKINKSRTIGISKQNIDFLNANGFNLKKLLWKIDKIEIYSDNLPNEKIHVAFIDAGHIAEHLRFDIERIVSKYGNIILYFVQLLWYIMLIYVMLYFFDTDTPERSTA